MTCNCNTNAHWHTRPFYLQRGGRRDAGACHRSQIFRRSAAAPPFLEQLLDCNGKPAQVELNVQAMLAALAVCLARIRRDILTSG